EQVMAEMALGLPVGSIPCKRRAMRPIRRLSCWANSMTDTAKRTPGIRFNARLCETPRNRFSHSANGAWADGSEATALPPHDIGMRAHDGAQWRRPSFLPAPFPRQRCELEARARLRGFLGGLRTALAGDAVLNPLHHISRDLSGSHPMLLWQKQL